LGSITDVTDILATPHVTDVTDILVTTLDIRNRHLEKIISYRDKYYHENLTDVTDITKGPLLTVTDIVLKRNLSHCFVL
jgi:hypothetical protein